MPKIQSKSRLKNHKIMAIELEIRDGSPDWYLSPDIWIVADPGDSTESIPLAGTPCYLKARVRNNGSTDVSNATVRFYWANPSIGVSRATATLIGESYVSLNAGDVDDVLCLTPWVPEFLNGGHECILAEAFHPEDPLPLTDFNVPTDRHVAQRNLSVMNAMNGMFHMNFEMHNPSRKEQKFSARPQQVKIGKLLKEFPMLEKQLHGKKEGHLKSIEFTNTICPTTGKPSGKFQKTSDAFALNGFGKKQLSVSGEIEGDFAFVTISQHKEETLTGGLGILIINHKNKTNDNNTNNNK